ncbi:uncharacterized protein DNG_04560 [Cephalotrichum gorgonifer]|uniref:Uncharacterized protein n=1 Tax=Cephalotrichum gorgonifer TaxID=2041049 RepID=A0AAE8MZ68_9PEZI|nr:uncharacterized protein DNG_04560 [Cephalotrichum gorgonifer]
MTDYPERPQTPTVMIHRLPDHPGISFEADVKPSKYIVLIIASNAIAGKVQIARSVASALSCPLFQGDSLHKTASRAAGVGVPQGPTGDGGDAQAVESGANEARNQRMWLSRMMRTGYLFPEESRPANEGFFGFGGTSSTSTSRRGSFSSVASSSDGAVSTSSFASSLMSSGAHTMKYVNKPPTIALSEDERLRKENPALLVVTHPLLEKWHRDAIRTGVGEYGIGVIFVPLHEDIDREIRILNSLGCFATVPKLDRGTLDEEMELSADAEAKLDDDEELPVLKPLDPTNMSSFGPPGSSAFTQKATSATLGEEIELKLNVEARVEDLTEDIVGRVRGIMYS